MSASSDKEIFSQRLKGAREMRELSQAELAARARLQPSAVSHFETGTRKPSFANLRRLADALDVSTDYLLGRVDSPNARGAPDALFRGAERLTARDRELLATMVEQMAKKAGGGDGEDSQ